MLKVMGICGVPASGKTSLMRRVMEEMDRDMPWVLSKAGTLEYHTNDFWAVHVLGRYDDTQFAGTDRLSMAVMSDAERFLCRENMLARKGAPRVILFEGDRLFYARFIRMITTTVRAWQFWQLMPSPEVWQERLKERSQPASFLRSRATKLANLRKQFPFILPKECNTAEDRERLVGEVLEWVS